MSEQLLHSIQLSTGLKLGSSKEKALHTHLNFSLNAGEIMLLVGRNGVGKSILLKTLAGMHAPLSGSVEIQGKALGNLSESERASCVSMVLATPPQDLRLSVLEVVMSGRFRFSSGFKGYQKEDENMARHWLKKMNLEGWSERLFLSLSDGEKQKVMLARCWAQDTPLLLLDEPLAFLDYPSRKEFLELLSLLCREEGKAAIYSSHDLSLSLHYCNSVLQLKQEGHVYYSDPSELSGDQWMLD
jgi:iron complex transport system ATP-binding protein